MHLVAYRQRPDVRRGRARASAARHRVCGGRHPAGPRGPRRGRHDARQHSRSPSTARRRRRSWRTRSRRTSRRTTACCSPITARWRSARTSSRRTTRWRRSSTSRASAWSRGCSAASICCRARKSTRLQALRGTYGIAAPAPICPDPAPGDADDPTCQVVVAPSAPGRAAGARHERRERLGPRVCRYGRGDSANIRAS